VSSELAFQITETAATGILTTQNLLTAPKRPPICRCVRKSQFSKKMRKAVAGQIPASPADKAA
jgi:hypothetical protein